MFLIDVYNLLAVDTVQGEIDFVWCDTVDCEDLLLVLCFLCVFDIDLSRSLLLLPWADYADSTVVIDLCLDLG